MATRTSRGSSAILPLNGPIDGICALLVWVVRIRRESRDCIICAIERHPINAKHILIYKQWTKACVTVRQQHAFISISRNAGSSPMLFLRIRAGVTPCTCATSFRMTSGTLGGAIKLFNDLRASDALIKGQFTDSRLGDIYQQLQDSLAANGHKPAAGDYALIDAVTANAHASEYEQARFAAEKTWLHTALDNIKALKEQVAYIATITDTSDGNAAAIPDGRIAQEGFDYQMALLIASEKTKAMATPLGGANNDRLPRKIRRERLFGRMLRSTGKNAQKRNPCFCRPAANDSNERQAA